ncbi:ARM repeat-containing protein [Fistulina hepatica ATCC 64428]|uniref:Nucleolar protein 9 n=1 Tax=Fistulina hepatica ATCC 64428 TaxID=1128425 RepID=A0A0D7ACM4_9AGAR|nr:ARM repeat-containing protein [Fistulina hepatica ATCC 64428]
MAICSSVGRHWKSTNRVGASLTCVATLSGHDGAPFNNLGIEPEGCRHVKVLGQEIKTEAQCIATRLEVAVVASQSTIDGLSAKARQAVQWGNALPTCRITEANNQVVAEKAVTSWVKSWNAKRQTRPALQRGWPPIADGHRAVMPKELRKRGKKNKKKQEERIHDTRRVGSDGHGGAQKGIDDEYTQNDAGPSWIAQSNEHAEDDAYNPEAPFGYVDPDIKAYFRTVDTQIRDWQNADTAEATPEGVIGPSSDIAPLLIRANAALQEMRGKEAQLATDPDCSVILERMLYSMDDFVRRVFMDSLSGSYDTLFRHRFASHVSQTLFSVATETVAREARFLFEQTAGVLPKLPESIDGGELRTLAQLVQHIVEEINPSFTDLIADPFASHVVRALLLLLCPFSVVATRGSGLRSKKSASWKAKQGEMKSMFVDDKVKQKADTSSLAVPEAFGAIARRLVHAIRDTLDGNEVRAMAASQVASPCLQILIEVEAEQGLTNDTDSLMDRVTMGLVSCPSSSEPSDYVGTLLRDETSSHMLEIVIARSPPATFDSMWRLYFVGSLTRLSCHPIANFVVSRAVERCSGQQLDSFCDELEETWPKVINARRVNVLRSAIDRTAALHVAEDRVCGATFVAFDLNTPEARKLLVARLLHLDAAPPQKGAEDTEPSLQNALVLQSLLRLSDPHCQVVIDSIESLSLEDRLKIAHHPISSRVLDAVIESPTVPPKLKRQFVLSWMDHWHELVDDRIGSRVGDRLWAFADTYLKEKIARSLFPHEYFLVGSHYGKFFLRKVNLNLLKRAPEEWKNQMLRTKDPAPQATPAQTKELPSAKDANVEGRPVEPKKDAEAELQVDIPPRSAKKRRRHEDEIDHLFNSSTKTKGMKKAKLETALVDATEDAHSAKDKAKEKAQDSALQAVLSAIQAAPKDEGKRHKKRRKQ